MSYTYARKAIKTKRDQQSSLKHFPQCCELSSHHSVQLSLAESCENLCGFGLHRYGKYSKPADRILADRFLADVITLSGQARACYPLPSWYYA
jgi:hypothetical protein